MDLPEVVRNELNDEPVAAQVGLGGSDLLLVTPTRTLVYRSEGLLSDESVSAYPHAAERIQVSEGRRKATVRLDYGLDGERTLALPTDRLDEALHPVLAGVLNAAGVTDPGETVKETFLLSELTVVVTSERLVRHVGEAVWDGDYEEYPYEEVTDLEFEEGNVATSVVVRLGDVQERFKVPNDRARALRECLVAAVLDHHGYDDLDAFRAARSPAEEADAPDTVDFGGGPDPLDAEPEPPETPGMETGPADAAGAADGAARSDREPAESRDSFTQSGFRAAGPVDDADLAAEVAALREAVEEQNALLEAHGERIEKQGQLFERLVEELRQGR